MRGRFKKHQHPLFLEDENFFQKSASVVLGGIAVELEPRRPIFEKCSHLREKGGADAFENDPPFMSKGTVQLHAAPHNVECKFSRGQASLVGPDGQGRVEAEANGRFIRQERSATETHRR